MSKRTSALNLGGWELLSNTGLSVVSLFIKEILAPKGEDRLRLLLSLYQRLRTAI